MSQIHVTINNMWWEGTLETSRFEGSFSTVASKLFEISSEAY